MWSSEWVCPQRPMELRSEETKFQVMPEKMRWSVAGSWLRCCRKAVWAHGADLLRCHNQSSNKWLWYSGLPKVRYEEGRAPRGKSIQQLPQTQANLRVIVHLKGTGVSKRSKRYGACVPAGKKQANDQGSGRPRSRYLSPVNKSVSEEMWRHQREPVPTKNWKMGRNPLENRASTKPVASPRNPLEPQYLGISPRIGFWEWEGVRQGSEAALWMGQARLLERGSGQSPEVATPSHFTLT